METITLKGKIRDGVVVLAEPATFVEGYDVTITVPKEVLVLELSEETVEKFAPPVLDEEDP